MIKTISFPKNTKIEEIINWLEDLRKEETGTLRLLYSEFLCFKKENKK